MTVDVHRRTGAFSTAVVPVSRCVRRCRVRLFIVFNKNLNRQTDRQTHTHTHTHTHTEDLKMRTAMSDSAEVLFGAKECFSLGGGVRCKNPNDTEHQWFGRSTMPEEVLSNTTRHKCQKTTARMTGASLPNANILTVKRILASNFPVAER